MIPFGSVVVDNIQNDLDARRMQAADHRLKFINAARVTQIARLGREKADRVVPPVIAQTALGQMPIIKKGLNGQ